MPNLDDRRFLQDLGHRIRERRLALGLTQSALAALCDLHRTFVGSVERGERNVSVLNLRLIARHLRLTPAVLLELPIGAGSPPGPESPRPRPQPSKRK